MLDSSHYDSSIIFLCIILLLDIILNDHLAPILVNKHQVCVCEMNSCSYNFDKIFDCQCYVTKAVDTGK